jgi:isoquinoline 1-oxidoreductase
MAAASVRELLTEMASQEWSLGKSSLQMEKGFVHHPTNGGKFSYADLAKGKKLLQKVNEEVKVIPADQWKVSGTSVSKANGKDFITGRHKYVSDLVLPGMVYGRFFGLHPMVPVWNQ